MMTYTEMMKMYQMLSERWGDEVVLAIHNAPKQTGMKFETFLDYCTACGGDWGGMLLTGVKHFWPEVYDATPDNMGHHAWECICVTIRLLGVDTPSED